MAFIAQRGQNTGKGLCGDRLAALSRLANAFVATYSLRMRGDCLRFQAQYLRRIRLPRWSDLSSEQQTSLKSAADTDDQALIDETVRTIYGLDAADWSALCAGLG